MKIEVPVFACDAPGCDCEFSYFTETRKAVVWREAKRVGWASCTITAYDNGVLIDPKGASHACPIHAPGRRGLLCMTPT